MTADAPSSACRTKTDAAHPPPSAAKARRWRSPPSANFEERAVPRQKRDKAPRPSAAGPWQAFAEANVPADLSTVHFIGRAVTPPRAPRYDTRFFTADATASPTGSRAGSAPRRAWSSWSGAAQTAPRKRSSSSPSPNRAGRPRRQLKEGCSHDLPCRTTGCVRASGVHGFLSLVPLGHSEPAQRRTRYRARTPRIQSRIPSSPHSRPSACAPQ